MAELPLMCEMRALRDPAVGIAEKVDEQSMSQAYQQMEDRHVEMEKRTQPNETRPLC